MLETKQEYNKACNYVAGKASELDITTNKFKLQKLVYRDIRNKFCLSSQFAVRIIIKVVDAYKRDKKDKKVKPTFKELGAINMTNETLKLG